MKEGRLVSNNRLKNLAFTGPGIGRTEGTSRDYFVLTRHPCMPELVYNSDTYKDLFWEVESGEMWKLSHQANPTNDCFICQKHKYAMIFVDKEGDNEDLEEIIDQKIIRDVSKNLNLHDMSDDYAPIICGSVVNGGFKRKL